MKNTRSADFCAGQIDVMTNFAVIANVVIKRVHCSKLLNDPRTRYTLTRILNNYKLLVEI